MADAIANGSTPEATPSSWFFSWMSEFRIGEDSTLPARWRGITTIAKNADAADVEALARLAFATRQEAGPERIAKFEAQFLEHDATFSARANARELQVLAASALLYLADATEMDAAPMAALAMASTSVEGYRKAAPSVDLLQNAHNALRRLSVERARRSGLPPIGQQYKGIFEAAVLKLKSQQDWDGAVEALAQAGSATTGTINQIQKLNGAALRALERRADQQDEELQMLWWLMGERSEDLDCAFEAVPAAARPLVFGKELAEHTLLPPGPPSVRALLSRSKLASRTKVELVAAIAACSTDWLKILTVPESTSPVTLPLHFAVVRQLETGPGSDWVVGWAAATGLPRDIAFSPLTLAELFYRERLLKKLLG